MTWPMRRLTWDADPFAEMERVYRQVGRLLEQNDSGRMMPAVNVWCDENQAVVVAAMPGVDPKAIAVTVTDDVLTVEGERKAGQPAEGETVVRSERTFGRFARSIRLPFEIENGKIQARCENGLLRVTLPRREATKPRKIAVEAVG